MSWLVKLWKKIMKITTDRDSCKKVKFLPIHNISYFFCRKGELYSDEYLSMFSRELSVPKDIVRNDLIRILEDVREDITCCVEYPYVDEFYRDSYYAFYSRKHSEYSRFCFRISFFNQEIKESNFYMADMTDKYWGYIVLRPTPKRIAGYTFFSPLIYQEHNYSCCLCKRTASIMGRKLTVSAFPFCGQDGDVGSCSETTLVIMMDYFSRRYNRYRRLLPSDITKYLFESNNERDYPSRGLDLGTISQLLHNYGFSVRIYSRNIPCNESFGNCYDEQDFKRHLYTYIDSGFPIYACTKEHAFLIIGKENKFLFDNPLLVTMNDNDRPYKKRKLDNDIISFIVPLSEKVYLDAEIVNPFDALSHISEEYKEFVYRQEDKTYQERLYLTTSRSYKDYIIHSNISNDSRTIIVCIAMPRFIWVCETIAEEDIELDMQQTPLTSVCIFDATECDDSYNYLLMVKSRSHLLFPTTVDNICNRKKKYSIYKTDEEILYPYSNNLKGEHTQWKNL